MPCQFFLIIDGINMQRDYEEARQAKTLYLLRYMAAKAMAESKGGKVDPLDVMYIPEYDDEIRLIRQQKEKEREIKDQKVYDKYKRLEGV